MKTLYSLVILFVSVYIHAQCEGTYQAFLNVNNINATFSLPHLLFNNINQPGYECPKGSGKHTVIASSIWMAGLEETDIIKASAGTYKNQGQDYYPGPLNEMGEPYADNCTNFDFIWSVNFEEVEAFKNSGFNESFLTENIRNWPGRNNPLFDMFALPTNKDLAPFFDANSDGIYNPLQGDYPICKGHQNLWWVINDAGEHTHSNALALEMQSRIYAYALESQNAFLNNTIFVEFELDYFGYYNVNHFHFGLFLDADIGNAQDDYMGSYPQKSMAYTYNSSDYDAVYGENPPIQVATLAKGMASNNGLTTGAAAILYLADEEWGAFPYWKPELPLHYYSNLRGQCNNGQCFINSNCGNCSGQITNHPFIFDGNPAAPQPSISECSWDTSPSNKRILLSNGPVTLSTGTNKSLKFAFSTLHNVPQPCPNLTPTLDSLDLTLNDFLSNPLIPTSNNSPNITQNLIQLSPNPASKQVSINSPQQAFEQLEIYNANGQLIQSHKGFTNQLNIENLANGQYLISFAKNKKRIATQKLVVLR